MKRPIELPDPITVAFVIAGIFLALLAWLFLGCSKPAPPKVEQAKPSFPSQVDITPYSRATGRPIQDDAPSAPAPAASMETYDPHGCRSVFADHAGHWNPDKQSCEVTLTFLQNYPVSCSALIDRTITCTYTPAPEGKP